MFIISNDIEGRGGELRGPFVCRLLGLMTSCVLRLSRLGETNEVQELGTIAEWVVTARA